MTRAWLILADILVTLLLLFSFTLLYLYHQKEIEKKPTPFSIIIPEQNMTFKTQIEQNSTMSYEEFMSIDL